MDPYELLMQSAQAGVAFKKIHLEGGLTEGRRVIPEGPLKKNAAMEKPKQGTAYAQKYRDMLGIEEDEDQIDRQPNNQGTMNALEDLTSYCTSEAPASSTLRDECLDVYREYSFEHISNTRLLIHEYHDSILSQIATNNVVIVKGPTGCGKTTQIPQYILDDAREANMFCNIIVTQPRRIAATSVAKRVCEERGWTIGTVVGYQIGLEKKTSNDTRITYCTAGVLLQRLVAQRTLAEFSHVIIDEVHERDSETDFLLIVIRKLMKLNSNRTKLILMSATMKTDKFQDYFTRTSDKRCIIPPVIDLPNHPKYPVDVYYLGDLQNTLCRISCDIDFGEPKVDISLFHLAALIINVFNSIEKRERSQFCGAVLIFLPGIYEIEQLYKILEQTEKDPTFETKLMLCPLHSTISFEDQMRVFKNPPSGKRKVILATNIAESSITVPDVKYVIDFCLTKHQVQNPDTFYSALQMAWITKSQATQRAGRVGRTMPGRVYRLIWKRMYEEEMSDQCIPEILQCPLDQLVLKAKVLNMGTPISILGSAIDPPDLSNIQRTVLNLKEMGALTLKMNGVYIEDDGDLTSTGRIMAELPLDTQLSKLILLGHMTSMLRECVMMACCMASRNIFSSSVGTARPLDSYNAKLTWSGGSNSDLLAYLKVYQIWREKKNKGEFMRKGGMKEEDYCRQKFLQLRSLREVERLETEVLGRLHKLGIVDEKIPFVSNKPMFHPFFLKLAIAGAFYPNYFINVPIEESEAVKTVGSRDPKKTVYFSKFPQNQPGPLYRESIGRLLSECGSVAKVQFDGSAKVYVEFGSNWHSSGTTDKSSDVALPSKVMPAVYRAVKLRQLNVPMKIPILSIPEAQKRAKQLFGDRWDQNVSCWQQPSKPLAVKESSIPKLGTSALCILITWVHNPHSFYAQRYEGADSSFFWLIHEINKREEGVLVDLPSGELARGVECLAPFGTGPSQLPRYYRAKILEVEKQHHATVFYIDYGNVERVENSSLKGYGPRLIGKGIHERPPYCFHCRLSEIQPISFASDDVWSHQAIQTMKCYENNVVDAVIFSVVDETVALRLYPRNNEGSRRNLAFEDSYNYWLVQEKEAELMEESYLSIENHNLRQKFIANPELLSSSSSSLDDHQKYLDTLHFPSPTREDTKLTHTLFGPRSPLEMAFSPMSRKCTGKSVSIDYNSINSVTLDSNPMNMCHKVVVAASVTQSYKGDRLTLRNTTLMPAVRGLSGLICLLFAPYVELRVDPNRTFMSGALCGLGCNEDGISYDQENDIEVPFDTKFTISDIETVNRIRFWINKILGGIQDDDCMNKQTAAQAQQKIVEYLLMLFRCERGNLSLVHFENAYEWNQVPEEFLMSSSVNSEHFIYPLIQGVDLFEPSIESKIEAIEKQLAKMKLIVDGSEMSSPMTCLLCEIYIETPLALKLHVTTTCHKSCLKRHETTKQELGMKKVTKK